MTQASPFAPLAKDLTDDPMAATFWRDGYRVVDALLTAEQCAFLRQGMDLSRRAGRMRVADNPAYRGPNNEYAPVAAQVLLGALTPRIAALVRRDLVPSFGFWRIYEHGALLNPHKDRTACEVSITIAIAGDPAEPIWPIGVTDLHGQDHSIALSPGAGLLYQGTKVRHWRAPLTGQHQYQMFLNYIVADGPFAAMAHDQGKAQVP